ncbi:condensin complex protein MksE [Sulfurimonas sp. CS5]|uniref:condensin complex protein MksE n=1 Tax=Sulfurimonas sp. CS5 TaxID=3391145 RepID=UPI0039E79D84
MNVNISFVYPEKHFEIVKNLLNGKFILHNEELFEVISDNLEFYIDFFQKSYDYELVKNTEVIYVISSITSEKFSRNIMLVLAVISWEFNREGKNIYTELENKHTIRSIEELIKKSSFKDSCRGINIDKLLKDAASRNLVLILDNEKSIKFTSAINIFLEAAKEIAELD